MVRNYVKDGFYKQDEDYKFELLGEMVKLMCQYYEAEASIIQKAESNGYDPTTKTMYLLNTSIISCLHELRHHLQHVIGKRKEGLTAEQDAHAWSIRAFAKACPNMFLKAVKEGRIWALVWDEETGQVINNPIYSQIQ
ncbi:MAG: hypothetical protein N2489_03745 [Clostridia bacterium]|nr:hypothetical protein [Clostridia bacterium]